MRYLLLLCLVFSSISISFAQEDEWTCDGGKKDILKAANAAFDTGDYETADELAILMQTLCTNNISYINAGLQLQSKIDRIQNPIPTATPRPPEMIKANEVMADCFNLTYEEAYEEALPKCEEALVLFQELEDIGNQSVTYSQLATIYHQTKDIEAVEPIYEAWIALYTDNPVILAQIYETIGENYTESEEYAIAIDYYERAIALYETEIRTIEVYRIRLMSVNVAVGVNYIYLGDSDKALDHFLAAQTLFESINRPLDYEGRETYFELLIGLGDAYQAQNKPEKAEEYFLQALDFIAERNIPQHLIVYGRLGSFYYAQEEYAQADEYYLQILDILENSAEFMDDQEKYTWYFTATYTLGYSQLAQDNLKEAEKYFSDLLATAIQIDDAYMKLVALRGLGDLRSFQDRPKDAVDYWQQALEIAEEYGYAELIDGLQERIDDWDK
jgi:tetratricopeptide (TPR) repeat protein